jgi:single-stranded-DNA-specific exonuclease
VTVDTILSEKDITDNHLADIEKIGPFGVGNPEPLFLLKDVTILKTEKV